MEEHPGVQRAKDYAATFAKGDFEALQDFYAEDVVWHVGGRHHLSGDYRGRETLFKYFDTVRTLTGGTMRLEPESIQASDKSTAIFMRVTAQRDDRSLDVVLAQLLRNGPDGRWTEYWAISDDQDAIDGFWG